MKNLAAQFYERAQELKDQPCLRIIPGEEHWTYAQAQIEVDQFRAGLRQNFAKGDRIFILIKPCGDLFFLMLACFAEGMIPFLVDPRLHKSHWLKSMKKANLRGLISEPELLKWKVLIPSFWKVKSFVTGRGVFLSRPLQSLKMRTVGSAPLVQNLNTDISLMTLTSGTTGEPKLVGKNYEAIYHQQIMSNKYLPKLQLDRHMAGYIVSVLQSMGEKSENFFLLLRSEELAHRTIAQHDIRRLSGPPGYMMKIVKHVLQSGQTLPQVESLLVGGAPISRDFYIKCRQAFPNAVVTIIYGATEAEPISFVQNPEPSLWNLGYPVGVPISELKIHRRDVAVKNQGGVFEIGLSGEHVVGEGVHWTGDLATEYQGQLILQGRRSDLVSIKGEDYSFASYEAQLEGQFGANRFAFVQGENQVVVYFDTESGVSPNLNKIRTWLSQNDQSLRFDLRPLEKIPVDARHEWKIQRRELKNF